MNNLLVPKSRAFGLRIWNLYKFLSDKRGEKVISKQVLRSGTSIGANIAESIYAESESDYIHKLSISRKEGSETLFWIELLKDAELLTVEQYDSLHVDCEELMKLLTATIKTLKQKE